MLAKDPAHRYETPLEAARAVRKFLLDKDHRASASTKKGQPSRKPIAQAAIPAIPTKSVSPSAPVYPGVGTVPTGTAIAQPLPAVSATPAPGTVDVELVAAVARADGTAEPGPPVGWSRRDWLIFAFGSAVGAGTILATGGLGLLLAKLLRRNSPESESPTPSSAGDQ